MQRRHLIKMAMTVAGSMALPASGWAAPPDPIPGGTLRIIVPLAAGGAGDTLSRYVAERMGKNLGRPIIVENRPGGDQVLAVQSLLNAPPDGSSLLMLSSSSLVINPLITKKPPYDPTAIRPLVNAVQTPALWVVPAGSPYRTFRDLMGAARSKPGHLSMATYTLGHEVGGALLEDMAKVEFTHVPYKSKSQMIADIVGGTTFDVGLTDVSAAAQLIRTGKARALAISDKVRSAELPEVPTVRESGVPGYEHATWVGFGVSARTPEATARALEAVLLKTIATPAFREFAISNGFDPLAESGAEISARVAQDTARYRKLIQDGRLARQ